MTRTFFSRLCAATVAMAMALSMAGAPARAQGVDDVLKGFGDDKPAPGPAKKTRRKAKPESPGWLAIGGGISQDFAWNYAHDAPPAGQTDHRGLSGLRSRLDLEADITLSPGWRARVAGYAFHDFAYAIQGRDGYTTAFLDQNESEAAFGEFFVQGKLRGNLDIRLGRQIVVWGKSDSIRVVDVLNPLDMRAPGRTDIADLRLPVTMSKLDYFFAEWNASFIVLHELRYSKLPVLGSDFFPGKNAAPPHDPESGFGEQEYAFALNGTFKGWDVSLHAAYIFDERPYFALTQDGARQRHGRARMFGAAANVALGSWLVKGEAAWFDRLQFAAAPGEKFSRFETMAGVEYSGFTDMSIALEAALRHMMDFDSRLAGSPDFADEDQFETALRVSQKFMNDTLDVGLVISTFWPKGGIGGFQRLQITYDWTDSVEISGGVINFDAANTPRLAIIGNNDRVFARVKYRF